MAFWLCVAVFVVILPVLYGLALAVIYLYIRWKGLLPQLLQKWDDRSSR